MRYVIGVLLLVLAALCAALGIVLLGNLLAGDLDSPASTFLLMGVFLVAIAVGIAARALELTWSGRPRALMAIMLGGSATALGTALLGILVIDESFWQPLALAAAVSIALIWSAPARR